MKYIHVALDINTNKYSVIILSDLEFTLLL